MENKNVWYEVFYSDEVGTKTLEICETLSEAKERQKFFHEIYDRVYIDKWTMDEDGNTNSEEV
jgi:hypothetical protein